MARVYGSITVHITKTRNRKHESVTVNVDCFEVDSSLIDADGLMERERVQLTYRGAAFGGIGKFTLRATYDVLGTSLFSRSIRIEEVSRGFVAEIDKETDTLHVEASRLPSSAD
jgi:hypothetical protein